MLWSKV